MLSEDHISRWTAALDRLDADENFVAIVQSVRSTLELAPKDHNVMAVASARLIDAGACLGRYRHGDRTKGEHPTLRDRRKRNIWLRALSDLRDDWFDKRFPGPFLDLRHVGTHRGLVLFSDSYGSPAATVKTIDDHAAEALLMLRSVKAAIEYLVLFINAEEKERTATAKKAGRTLTRPLNLRPGKGAN